VSRPHPNGRSRGIEWRHAGNGRLRSCGSRRRTMRSWSGSWRMSSGANAKRLNEENIGRTAQWRGRRPPRPDRELFTGTTRGRCGTGAEGSRAVRALSAIRQPIAMAAGASRERPPSPRQGRRPTGTEADGSREMRRRLKVARHSGMEAGGLVGRRRSPGIRRRTGTGMGASRGPRTSRRRGRLHTGMRRGGLWGRRIEAEGFVKIRHFLEQRGPSALED